MITHTAKLPGGFTAEFRWNAGMHVEWMPDTPGRNTFRSARAFAKFMRSYTAERAAFLQMVALELGGTIAVVEAGRHPTVTITRPPTRQ
jgi:hypothetical protein